MVNKSNCTAERFYIPLSAGQQALVRATMPGLVLSTLVAVLACTSTTWASHDHAWSVSTAWTSTAPTANARASPFVMPKRYLSVTFCFLFAPQNSIRLKSNKGCKSNKGNKSNGRAILDFLPSCHAARPPRTLKYVRFKV